MKMCDAADIPHPPTLVDVPQDQMRLLHDAIDEVAKSKSEETLGRLALLYHEMSRSRDESEQARVLYEQVKTIAPQSYKWPYFLGRLFFMRQSYERSRMEFEESFRLNPDYTMNLAWIGEIESRRQNHDEAIDHFEKYRQSVDNTAFADLGLATAHLAKEDHDAFLRAIGSAQAIVGDCGRIRMLLAKYFENQQKTRVAEAHRSAARSLPYLPGALSYDPLQLEMWRPLRDSSAVIGKIQMFASSGDLASALLLTDSLLSDFPNSPVLIQASMELHNRVGDSEESLSAAKRLLKQNPTHPTALSVATGKLLSGERFDELMQLAESTIRSNPQFAGGYACAAFAKAGKKEYDAAESSMQRALELAPENEFYLDALADMQIAQKKFGQADETLKQMLSIKTDAATMQEIRLMAYVGLADLNFIRDHEDAAFDYLGKAVNQSPQDDRVLRPLIHQTLERRRVDKAESILGDVLERDPKLTQPRIALSEILMLSDRNDDAIALLEEGVKLHPDDTRFHSLLAGRYQRGNRLDDAVNQLKKLIEIQPTASGAFGELSAIELRRSNPAEALKYARKGLQLKPQDPLLINTTAWILSTYTDVLDAKRAVQLATQACKLTREQEPNYLDTLASAYAADGQFDKAIQTEKKALEIAKTNPQQVDLDELRERLALFESGKPYVSE